MESALLGTFINGSGMHRFDAVSWMVRVTLDVVTSAGGSDIATVDTGTEAGGIGSAGTTVLCNNIIQQRLRGMNGHVACRRSMTAVKLLSRTVLGVAVQVPKTDSRVTVDPRAQRIHRRAVFQAFFKSACMRPAIRCFITAGVETSRRLMAI